MVYSILKSQDKNHLADLLSSYGHIALITENTIRNLFDSNYQYLFRKIYYDIYFYKDIEIILPPGINLLVALGGGKIIDYTKLLAFKYNIPWIAIPTKTSSSVFTSTISYKNEDKIETKLSSLPLDIFFFIDILLKIPRQLLIYDYIDTWSFQTAFVDLLMAKFDINEDIKFDYIERFNYCTSKLMLIHKFNEENDLINFIDVQRILSITINDNLTTKYVSGSEHLFAHGFNILDNSLNHGYLVGVGIFWAKVIQESFIDIARYLKSLDFRYIDAKVWKDLNQKFGIKLVSPIAFTNFSYFKKFIEECKHIRIPKRYTVLDRLDDFTINLLLNYV